MLPFYLIWDFDDFHIIKSKITFIRIFFSLFLAIIGILVHELIHGIFFSKYASHGFKSIKFGVLWKTLTPYCHCKEPLKVKHYIVGVLAPLFVVGVLPAILGIVLGNLGLTIFGVFFSGAAAGDIMIYNLIKKENPEDYVQDHPSEAGCYIFREKQKDGEK